MRIACPACGRKDATENAAGATCDRCGCDLSALRDVKQVASALLVRAKTAMAESAWADAQAHAARSWALARSRRSAGLACLAAAALGDPVLLARWRGRLASRAR